MHMTVYTTTYESNSSIQLLAHSNLKHLKLTVFKLNVNECS